MNSQLIEQIDRQIAQLTDEIRRLQQARELISHNAMPYAVGSLTRWEQIKQLLTERGTMKRKEIIHTLNIPDGSLSFELTKHRKELQNGKEGWKLRPSAV